jgi:alginate export protein
MVGYTFKNTKFSPRYSAEYNFASGDGSSKDGTRQTFDQLFSTNHSKYGTADVVGWRNIHSMRVGSELKLTPNSNISVDYLSHWLARKTDSLYNDSGIAIAQVRPGAEARHVGEEIDFIFQLIRVFVNVIL